MTLEHIAAVLPFACLVAALVRAPLVALSLLPPCALILASRLELVDLSSASHPLRWITPVSSLSLALLVAWYAASTLTATAGRQRIAIKRRDPRTIFAALLVFASGCVDVLALPLWRLPGLWALVPVQIVVCVLLLGILVVPERAVHRWTT